MKNKFKIIIASVSAIGLQAFAGGSSTVGPSNPAAVNCLKLGGFLENTETATGQDANCIIEEWQLYREMSKRGLVQSRPHDHGSVAMPNPAAVNCIDIKGTLRIEDSLNGQRGLCVVRQWDLFRAIDVTGEN